MICPLLTGLVLAPAASANPIQVENARPGTSGWPTPELTDRSIEGYASEVSAEPGDTVRLHVSTTPSADYRILVYRLGWYQGIGARLVTCVPSCEGSAQGSSQPVGAPDPTTGLLDAGWPVTDRLRVGEGWVSGYYQIKLLLTSGPHEGTSVGVPLIVREAPSDSPSTILVQVPVNTWQAYNFWGGKSLYDYNSSDRHSAVKVSFDRPWGDEQRLWNWEYNVVRFLERQGYDVSYTTDVDTDADPGELLHHSLVLDIGHDEYWTKGMVDAFEAARDRGVDLAFFGSNLIDTQVRYEDGRRTLVNYHKGSLDPEPDPALKTDKFRLLSPARPQCSLLGVQFTGRATSQDYGTVAGSLADPWFAGTGFGPGSVIKGVVGYEQDGILPGCEIATRDGSPLTAFFHYQSPDGKANADAVRYTAPSGARVFSTGTLQWAYALDDWSHPGFLDPRLQRFSENVLDDLGGAPPVPETGIHSGANGLTNDTAPSFSFYGPWASGFQCRLNGGSWSTCTSPQRYSELADGDYRFEVRSEDAAGNFDPTPAKADFTVDATPPAVFLARRSTGSRGVGRRTQRIYFRFGSNDAEARFWCRIDARRFRRCSSPKAYRFRPGVHAFAVRAVDRAGNVGTAKRRFRVGRAR